MHRLLVLPQMLMFLLLATSLTEQSIRNETVSCSSLNFVHADTEQFVKYTFFF